jgi:hypothetical protein
VKKITHKFNSALLVDHTGAATARYDKQNAEAYSHIVDNSFRAVSTTETNAVDGLGSAAYEEKKELIDPAGNSAVSREMRAEMSVPLSRPRAPRRFASPHQS